MSELRNKSRRSKTIVIASAVLMVSGLVLAKPTVLRYRLRQARQAIVDRNPELAIQRLQIIQQSYGNNAEASFLMARAHRHREAYDQVIKELKEARGLGYAEDKLKREQLLTAAESGKIALDDPELQDLLANPGNDDREIYEALVKGYYRLYELGPASLVLDVWQQSYPQDAQPLLYQGLLREHEENWVDAAQWLRQAVSLAPERPDLRRHLAKAEQKQHNYRQAVHHYRVALQQREEVESLLGLGTCLKARGEIENAREAFSRGLALSHDHYGCFLALGELDVEAGKGADALRWLEPAAQLKPREYDARYGLAKALLFAGRDTEARPHFQFAASARQELSRVKAYREYVASHPEDTDMRYEIGKGLAQYGEPREALQWLNSVLKYAPDHQFAHELLAELYAGQGNESAAARHRAHSRRDR
ncbi:MAG: tetratricopeptide repeat protein [Planctomycetes bacterium]|nr:tetratricopeptide repeat protein [Planctomycetota bacterium]